jgi:hypothetical protein
MGVVLMAACTNAGVDTAQSPSATHQAYSRVGVYEAMIRYLAQPKPMPIYVAVDLCFQLLPPAQGCPEKLSHDEEVELTNRLADLGKVDFRSASDPHPSPSQGELKIQGILLSPIVEEPDGLRVEGGTYCGNLCGKGAVYVVAPTASGYEVRGTDDSYGAWIS